MKWTMHLGYINDSDVYHKREETHAGTRRRLRPVKSKHPRLQQNAVLSVI
jgi:hypothetical protein